MAGGRRGGRRLSPAEEEREGGEDPPLLTLNVGEKDRKSKPNNISIHPTGANYVGSSASKHENNQ